MCEARRAAMFLKEMPSGMPEELDEPGLLEVLAGGSLGSWNSMREGLKECQHGAGILSE